jgi:hypothetical protein
MGVPKNSRKLILLISYFLFLLMSESYFCLSTYSGCSSFFNKVYLILSAVLLIIIALLGSVNNYKELVELRPLVDPIYQGGWSPKRWLGFLVFMVGMGSLILLFIPAYQNYSPYVVIPLFLLLAFLIIFLYVYICSKKLKL